MWTIASPPPEFIKLANRFSLRHFKVFASSIRLPEFLPNQVQKINDTSARNLASRIQRLPVDLKSAGMCIMSSAVKPLVDSSDDPPLLLLHGFDSSCLEWRYALPMLEEFNFECWTVDVLGWGFSNLETLPPCTVASKRDHLYQLWKTFIKKPVVLVGPSLGAAIAIDFAVNHPQAVEKLILINASVYTTGKETQGAWSKMLAYAGVNVLKSIPLRFYAIFLAYKKLSLSDAVEQMKVGRLHCLYPWWEDATVDFMMSGGYNVIDQIKKVEQRVCIICGEDDQIVDKSDALRLQSELRNAELVGVPNCGHLPHVEAPDSAVKIIKKFIKEESK